MNEEFEWEDLTSDIRDKDGFLTCRMKVNGGYLYKNLVYDNEVKVQSESMCFVPDNPVPQGLMDINYRMRFQELEEQYFKLQKQVMELIGEVNELNRHRVRQIDENRKISRKVEHLESENNMRADDIGCLDQTYNDALLDFERRLIKVEQSVKG